MPLYNIGMISTHLIMNEISETYLRDASDGSVRFTSSMYLARKFKHEADAERHIKQLGLKNCKIIELREPIDIEVKS